MKPEILHTIQVRELQIALPSLDQLEVCLLYTSDAADERSSVDLGGRRIIKKKKETESRGGGYH